jgi:hypothetical protein
MLSKNKTQRLVTVALGAVMAIGLLSGLAGSAQAGGYGYHGGHYYGHTHYGYGYAPVYGSNYGYVNTAPVYDSGYSYAAPTYYSAPTYYGTSYGYGHSYGHYHGGYRR